MKHATFTANPRRLSSSLCRASKGLQDEPGLRTAYFSYNHSLDYVERVLSFARLYEHAVEVPDRAD